jgi:dihydroorotate dehydrogenase
MKDDLFSMPIKIGNLELRNPFIVASGPTAKRVEQLELAECGWGPPPSADLQPLSLYQLRTRYRWLKKEKLHVFTAEFRLDMESGLRLMEEGRKKCKDLVLIANYSYVKDDIEGWKDAARRFDAAGAQILELNFCCPNMSFNVDVSERMSKDARPSSGASMGRMARPLSDRGDEEITSSDHRQNNPEGGRIAEVSVA